MLDTRGADRPITGEWGFFRSGGGTPPHAAILSWPPPTAITSSTVRSCPAAMVMQRSVKSVATGWPSASSRLAHSSAHAPLRAQQVAFALAEGDVELRVRRIPGADRGLPQRRRP
jgi:hypothetical protein